MVLGWVVVQVHPKMGQSAHPKATVDKEPFGDKLSAEGQPCLHLVAVKAGILLTAILRVKGHLISSKTNDSSRAWKKPSGLHVTLP